VVYTQQKDNANLLFTIFCQQPADREDGEQKICQQGSLNVGAGRGIHRWKVKAFLFILESGNAINGLLKSSVI